MDEYARGFEDALDLVNDYMERCRDKLPEKFVLQIKEVIQEARDKRILELKKEFSLTDSEIHVEGKKTKR
jgi:hypothetical protein